MSVQIQKTTSMSFSQGTRATFNKCIAMKKRAKLSIAVQFCLDQLNDIDMTSADPTGRNEVAHLCSKKADDMGVTLPPACAAIVQMMMQA